MKKSLASTVLAAAICTLLAAGCNSADKKTAETPKSPQPAQPVKVASMGLVNAKCPIMPSHAAGDKVTADFKGQKVGFCCAGCMPAWNKLTDAEKAAKLAAAK